MRDLAAVQHAADAGLLDAVRDLDLEVVRGELETWQQVTRLDHEAHGRGVGHFRLQVDVAFEAPVAGVTRVERTGGARRAEPEQATGGDLLPVVELAEVRRTAVTRLAGTHTQPLDRIPDAGNLVGGHVVRAFFARGALLALVLVARVAGRKVQLQATGQRRVPQQRHVDLGIAFGHVHVAGKALAVLDQVVVADIVRHQVALRIALRPDVLALLLAVLGTRCTLHGAGAKAFPQVARGVERKHLLLIGQRLKQVAEGIGPGRLVDGAHAERVDRHAALRHVIEARTHSRATARGDVLGHAAADAARGIHAVGEHRVERIGVRIAVLVVVDQLRALGVAVLPVAVPGPGRVAEAAIQAHGEATHFRVELGERIHLARPVLGQGGRATREELCRGEASRQARVQLQVGVVRRDVADGKGRVGAETARAVLGVHFAPARIGGQVDRVGELEGERAGQHIAIHRRTQVGVRGRTATITRRGIRPESLSARASLVRDHARARIVGVQRNRAAKRLVPQAIAGDGAADVVDIDPSRIARERVGRGVVGAGSGVGDRTVVRGAPTADVLATHRVGVLVLVGDRDMATVVGKTGAERRCNMAIATVLVHGLAEVRFDLAAVELLRQKDVVDARDGTRAVGRRGTAGHDIQAFNEDGRNEVEVNAITLVRRHEAATVHQRQRAAAEEGVQAAQVGDGRTGEEVGVAGRGRRVVRHVRRQRLDRIAHVHDTHVLEIVRINDRGRIGGVEVRGALDARAGDLHFFKGLVGGEGLRDVAAQQGSTQDRGDRGANAMGAESRFGIYHGWIPLGGHD